MSRRQFAAVVVLFLAVILMQVWILQKLYSVGVDTQDAEELASDAVDNLHILRYRTAN